MAPFRLGVASCSNYPQGYFHACRDMANSDLDLVLHLGDYLYEYHEVAIAIPLLKTCKTIGNTQSVKFFGGRLSTALCAVSQRSRSAGRACGSPVYLCLDDHELMNNTWKDGAENHNEGEGDFYQRVASAKKAITSGCRFEPPHRPIRHHPSKLWIGDLADLIMLNTHVHGRDEQLDYQRDVRAAKWSPFSSQRFESNHSGR